MQPTWRHKLGSFIGLAALLASCSTPAVDSTTDGTTASGAVVEETSSTAPSMRIATLRLPWVFESTWAHYFLAIENGYYAAEGWDVSILPGRGSNITVQLVGQGRDTFGVSNTNAVVQYISDGGNLIGLAAEEREYAGSFIYRASEVQLDSLDDLIGKTVISSPGDSYYQALLTLLSNAGIAPEEIDFQLADPSAMPALFRNDPQAIQVGGIDSEAIEYREQIDESVVGKSLSEFGFTMYGQLLHAQASFLREEPEAVCSFVSATLRGLSDAIANPAAALEAMAAAEQDLAPELGTPEALEAIEVKLGLAAHPTDPSASVGLFMDADMEAVVTFLANANGFDPLPLSDYYTNQCFPEA